MEIDLGGAHALFYDGMDGFVCGLCCLFLCSSAMLSLSHFVSSQRPWEATFRGLRRAREGFFCGVRGMNKPGQYQTSVTYEFYRTQGIMDLINSYCHSVYLSVLMNPANQRGWPFAQSIIEMRILAGKGNRLLCFHGEVVVLQVGN